MIFAACDGYTAHELAAVAAYHFRTVSLRVVGGICTGIEINRSTRHPRYKRSRDNSPPCITNEPTPSVFNIRNAAARLIGEGKEVDSDAVAEFLAERGWLMGQTLPHSECPIDPNAATTHTASVTILDGGLFCHKCDAAGMTFPGCRRTGFVPFAMLIDSNPTQTNPIRAAVRNFAHWEHTRHVFRHLVGKQSDRNAENLYRALLKLHHLSSVDLDETDRRDAIELQIKRVFFPEIPIVWLAGHYWSNIRNPGVGVPRDAKTKYVASLPATKYVDEAGKVQKKGDAEFFDAADLTAKGYPALTPIRGVDMLQQIGNPENASGRIPFLVPADPQHTYYPAADRDGGGVEWRHHFSREFPGIDTDCLKLLIGTAGFSQRLSLTEPIRIMFTGPTGSGKTTTVDVAADVLGGTSHGVNLHDEPDKFVRGYVKAAASHVFALMDECAKGNLDEDKFSARALKLRIGAGFHEMYVGAGGLARLVPHIYTDTLLPYAMVKGAQLRRRFLHAHYRTSVPPGKDWKITSGGVLGWRKRHELNTIAADMLVSEVLDDLRRLNGPQNDGTIEAYARELGVEMLNANRVDGHDPDEVFRELCVAVLAAPEPDKPDGKFKGEGWRMFTLEEPANPLALAWKDCGNDAGTVDLQTISGRQWDTLMDVEGLSCTVREHRRRIAIRSSIGDPRSPKFRAGSAILDTLPVEHPLRVKVDAAKNAKTCENSVATAVDGDGSASGVASVSA